MVCSSWIVSSAVPKNSQDKPRASFNDRCKEVLNKQITTMIEVYQNK